jgi:hypothetical protein
MSLAFALMAANNGSKGSCATLSHGLFRIKPRRRQPPRHERFSYLTGDGASAVRHAVVICVKCDKGHPSRSRPTS